ncbi:hydroxyacylglutathione hydrolase [Siccirubricoccus sp. KC 17139]|uniref:Hydroxyacylglutathione hydrolase n=1 Tax=Siccirubricoccus soli TaxID=2899147 RepID=A0ABT1DE59_9PROT|nr:hydroxyacylglutathione hydrolase [Siccirubricoccus soli]MCO6419530.1 hydroxyacylglutathione hydrolase [Siccirubricoccus soli]MCP2685665.1 hydroxyacylglutathione hydrolase [Siccirubricoccus soli]
MPVSVQAIPCLSDNYAWALKDAATGTVAICDPGEAGPIIAALEKMGGRCDLILLTHHHGDHVAGVEEVRARFGARVVGAKADAHRLPKLDVALAPGEKIAVGATEGVVIDTPGHTVGHIAFHFPEGHVLLCGDTLFSLGCGRLLEGDATMMFRSLAALAALPDATLVCCGHEYTESNARFALTVEPENQALVARAAEAKAQRAAGKFTVPTTIAEEKAANPFVRAKDVARLAAIRSAKDNFR